MSGVRYVGEVELDARRRISLGRMGRREHTRYRVEVDEMGVLTLTPLVSVPVSMLTEDLQKALDEAAAGDVVERPAFTSSSGTSGSG